VNLLLKIHRDMKTLRPIARVILLNPDTHKLLLARNEGSDFWYPPGGGWEYDREGIKEAAKREVLEEVGLDVEIGRLLYTQEFHMSDEVVSLETFWLAYTTEDVPEGHEPDGAIEELHWFTQEELRELTVYPKRLKDVFWQELEVREGLQDNFVQ
jgi:ADP-ribose pyrophosphatase YjhB (NUDIX family)